MKCPFCGKGGTEVLESRVADGGKEIRRRRICTKCKRRFTTYESVRGSTIMVVKKDGRREAFDKEKIKRGILRSVEKRPISMELVNRIVDDVERDILKKQTEEVSSKEIGRSVLAKLKKIDKVAWLRFASVYLEFEDLKDFERLIR
jgi:transcriptional repressor NrdR